ncbi:MAG: hypothetical protein JNL36_05795 [Candidatus Kapabacteria bacterium]|nr:hypothetical protein [Candidatus Kapabacteria bacterium]
MKKLLFLIFLLLPISVFSQYSEVWKATDMLYESVNKPFEVSKIKVASNGSIYVSLANLPKVPQLSNVNNSGEVLSLFYNDVTKATAIAQNKEKTLVFFVDESNPNKFLLQEGNLQIRYYNLLQSEDVKETYSYPITHPKSFPIFYDSPLLSKEQNLRKYSCIFDNDFGLAYADTVWLGNVFEGKRIQNYIFSSSGVFNENEKNFFLSTDTLEGDPNQAIGVPVAIRRFSNQDFLVVIASEDVPSSKPVNISYRILDSNFLETFRYKIDASKMNLNGGNLTIRDVELMGDVIFMTGYTYTNSGIKHPFFARINRDGTMRSYKSLSNNAEMKRLVKLNDNALLAVGKTMITEGNEVVTKRYLVELASDLTVNQSIEFSGEGNGYLNDVAVSPEGEVYIGGSQNGLPYLAKVANNVTTVQAPQPVTSTMPNEVFIHPNPAKSSVSLTMPQALLGNGSIRLYTMDGSLVATFFEGVFSQQKDFTFSVASLPSGSYSILIDSPNHKIRSTINIIR